MEDKVKQIIIKKLKVDKNKLDVNTSLRNGIGIDSLDLMMLVSSLEEEFNITIDLNEVSEIDTVNEIVNYLSGKLNETK